MWLAVSSVAPQILQGAGKRTAASESIAVRRIIKNHEIVAKQKGSADATPSGEGK
jgi:hypothetical protein